LRNPSGLEMKNMGRGRQEWEERRQSGIELGRSRVVRKNRGR
jgi:hypothetical protein